MLFYRTCIGLIIGLQSFIWNGHKLALIFLSTYLEICKLQRVLPVLLFDDIFTNFKEYVSNYIHQIIDIYILWGMTLLPQIIDLCLGFYFLYPFDNLENCIQSKCIAVCQLTQILWSPHFRNASILSDTDFGFSPLKNWSAKCIWGVGHQRPTAAEKWAKKSSIRLLEIAVQLCIFDASPARWTSGKQHVYHINPLFSSFIFPYLFLQIF